MRELYAGIDLHANNNYLCIIIESLPGQTLFLELMRIRRRCLRQFPGTPPRISQGAIRSGWIPGLRQESTGL